MSCTINIFKLPQQLAPLSLAAKRRESRQKSGHDHTPCITDLAAIATVTSQHHEDDDTYDGDRYDDDDDDVSDGS